MLDKLISFCFTVLQNLSQLGYLFSQAILPTIGLCIYSTMFYRKFGMQANAVTVEKNKTFILREATTEDTPAIFDVFGRTVVDLEQRLGAYPADAEPLTPEDIERLWTAFASVFNHLGATAYASWVAEMDGQIMGYARSILRADMLELTDFFVLPTAQDAGIGKSLLAKVFPKDTPYHRSIIATSDLRALGRYLKEQVYIQFPVYKLYTESPQVVEYATDIQFKKFEEVDNVLPILNQIDHKILEVEREIDHQWFMDDRQGYLYYRGDKPVGYGYMNERNSGPFALLDDADFPAILAHAETIAATSEQNRLFIAVPMINQIALDYLLMRNFKMHPSFCYVMSEKSFGKFTNYLQTRPMLFI